MLKSGLKENCKRQIQRIRNCEINLQIHVKFTGNNLLDSIVH